MKKPWLFAYCLLSFLAGIGVTTGYAKLLQHQQRRVLPSPTNGPFDKYAWTLETSLFKAVKSNKDIVMLGDSRIGMMDWRELLGRDDISTRGISSETLYFALQRLDISIPQRAKAVFIQSGINDVALGATDADILNNYGEMMDRLKTKADHVVVTSIIQSGHNHEDWHQRILGLNTELKKMAAARQLDWMDVNAVMCPTGYLEKSISHDGVHFSFESYQKWSRLIEQKLSQFKI